MSRFVFSKFSHCMALLCTLLFVTGVHAADNYCADQARSPAGGGIGGTGKQSGGIGGTGRKPGGIGGTGKTARRPGIGGTGKTSGEGGTGIGGTGRVAGVVGTITRFGSICVNGIRVHYNNSTPVRINGVPASNRQLSVGQVVRVALRYRNRRWQARSINIDYLLQGPVTAVNPWRSRILVMNQVVQLPRSFKTRLKALLPGKHVVVSGLRVTNGRIHANFFRVQPARKGAVLTGVIRYRFKTYSINGQKLILSAGQRSRLGRLVKSNRVYRVSGQVQHGKLVARSIKPLPVIPFGGRIKRLSLEGYLTRMMNTGMHQLDRMPVEIPAQLLAKDTRLSRSKPQRVQIVARIENRRVIVERIDIRAQRHEDGAEAGRERRDRGRGDDDAADDDKSSGQDDDKAGNDDELEKKSGETSHDMDDDKREGREDMKEMDDDKPEVEKEEPEKPEYEKPESDHHS